MANAPDPRPPPAPQQPGGAAPTRPDPDEMVILRVRMRLGQVAQMQIFAAREGASVEALAALWLEEKLAEATSHRPGGHPPAPGGAAPEGDE